MLDLLPDPARIALLAASGLYAGFWLLVLVLAGVSSVWRCLSQRLRR